MRRLTRLTGAVAATLLVVALSGCTSGKAANQTGYVGSAQNLTRIAPADRKPVPAISGTSLDGKPIDTSDYAGKVVVINVWGAWCNPCREEMPGLQKASVELAETAQVVGINTRDYDPANARAFVRAQQVTYPSIYNPSGDLLLQFSGLLPPSAIPSTLIIDAEGRLAARVLGSISEITLVDMVDDVAAGT